MLGLAQAVFCQPSDHLICRLQWDLIHYTTLHITSLVVAQLRSHFASAGGIAAYNMGDGNVHSYENVDGSTTGGDYSNDVVARAQWYS